MGPPAAVAEVRHAVRGALGDLPPGALVLVACSGGADSLALAAAAAHEGPRLRLDVGAVTVDHGLQDGSAARAGQVAATLRELGLAPVRVATVRADGPGGPEAAARTARYEALDAAADELGAAAVLLAHTRDDQAETVLLRLARGSGARSLAGMAPVAGRYRRPLLDLTRLRVGEMCAAAGLTPWHDPHNADPAYARSRVRHDALPVLEHALGPGVAAALARTARLLRDDADALDAWATRAHAECRAGGEPGLSADALAALPAAVRTRVLRLAAVDAGCPPGALGAVHLGAADRLVTDWHGQATVDLPGGVACVRRHGRLCFRGHHETAGGGEC
ncbi:MAG: tRNA lysidine(34) synthetase TilS [Streptosporangiales bacterium]|nr:tRNA lysidine(34) synthetase TilS [Streptosporangiales bacterium]